MKIYAFSIPLLFSTYLHLCASNKSSQKTFRFLTQTFVKKDEVPEPFSPIHNVLDSARNRLAQINRRKSLERRSQLLSPSSSSIRAAAKAELADRRVSNDALSKQYNELQAEWRIYIDSIKINSCLSSKCYDPANCKQ